MTVLLTAREVAARLSVATETVLRWHRRGDLPGVRLASNLLRFDESEVDRFIVERSGRGNALPRALTPAGATVTAPPSATMGGEPVGLEDGGELPQPKGGHGD